MKRLALGALLVAASCGGRASCPPPRSAGVVDPRPFLWEVQGPSATVVLFGTFHAGGRMDIPQAAITRLRGARVFVSEVPPLDAAKLEPLMTLPRGQSLPDLLGDDAWYDLKDALSGVIQEETLRRTRPWYAMSLLTSEMTDTPSPSMDNALAEEAKSAGAKLEYLETAEEQLGALGESVTADDLKQAIADRKKMQCTVSDLTLAYRHGDVQAIRGELSGDAETILLDDRNERWIGRIETFLKGDGAFVAVGVSHLVGDKGLAARLEAKGYKVTRLEASPAK